MSQEIVKTLRKLIKKELSDFYLTKKRGNYLAHQFDGQVYDDFHSPKNIDLGKLFQAFTELFQFDPFKPAIQDAKQVIRVDNKEVTVFGFFLPLIDGDRLELRLSKVK